MRLCVWNKVKASLAKQTNNFKIYFKSMREYWNHCTGQQWFFFGTHPGIPSGAVSIIRLFFLRCRLIIGIRIHLRIDHGVSIEPKLLTLPNKTKFRAYTWEYIWSNILQKLPKWKKKSLNLINVKYRFAKVFIATHIKHLAIL